jgi:hypothetical protein
MDGERQWTWGMQGGERVVLSFKRGREHFRCKARASPRLWPDVEWETRGTIAVTHVAETRWH